MWAARRSYYRGRYRWSIRLNQRDNEADLLRHHIIGYRWEKPNNFWVWLVDKHCHPFDRSNHTLSFNWSDHTELLGRTLEEISWQKAGIMKPGCPTVTAPQTGNTLFTDESWPITPSSIVFRSETPCCSSLPGRGVMGFDPGLKASLDWRSRPNWGPIPFCQHHWHFLLGWLTASESLILTSNEGGIGCV